MGNNQFRIPASYIMICLLWGSTWLAIKIGLESMTPFYSSGARFIVAAIGVYLLMRLRGLKLQTDKTSQYLYYFMAFFSFVIPFGLVYWSQQFVPSGLSAVLFGLYPFSVAIVTRIMIPSEKIDAQKIIGMILGFAGIVIIFSDRITTVEPGYLIGMMAILLSAVMQSVIAVTIKKYGEHLNPISMNFVPMAVAGLSMLILGFLFEDVHANSITLSGVGSLLYLGIFGSVFTFTTYYWLLKRIHIILLALVAFITPIVALFLGWIVYDEMLTSQHLTGTVFVLFGILAANIRLNGLKMGIKI